MSQSAKSQPEIIPFGAKALVVLVLAVYIIVANKEKGILLPVLGQK